MANHARSITLSLDVCRAWRLQARAIHALSWNGMSPHMTILEAISARVFLVNWYFVNDFRIRDGFFLHAWEYWHVPGDCKSPSITLIYCSVSPKCELRGSPRWNKSLFFWTLFLQLKNLLLLVELLTLKWNLSYTLKYISWKSNFISSLNRRSTDGQRFSSFTSIYASSLISLS